MVNYRYVLERVLWTIPVLLVATFFTFFLMFLAPGGPVTALFGTAGSEEEVAQLREQYGFDRPIPVQYLDWLTDILQGDMGTTVVIRTGTPVSEILTDAVPITVELAFIAMMISVIVGLPLGMISAMYRDTWKDHVSRLGAVAGVSMPTFWLGLIGLMVVGVMLEQRWALRGYVPMSEGLVPHYFSLALPSMALSVPYIALIARMTRSSMIDSMQSEFVTNGRAMGITERELIFRDVFRNGFIPVFTVIGMSFGLLLRGTVLIEIVFGIPGIGFMITEAAFSRDFPLIQGIMLVIVLIFVTTNLVTDLLYQVIDPRITYEDE